MLSIKEVLSEEELTVIRDYLSEADFVDGKHSAGELIKHRKDNLQLSKQAEGIDLLNKVIIDALSNNALFCNWVQPMRYTQPLHARYEKGMKYKAHIDAAVMGGHDPLRCDVSITVFLSDPEDYDGGELAIESDGQMKKVKLNAGDVIVYPTQAIHEVCEVTRGVRTVSVLWAQSQIKDPAMRRLLFDLGVVSMSIGESAPNSNEALLLQKSYNNLHRYLSVV